MIQECLFFGDAQSMEETSLQTVESFSISLSSHKDNTTWILQVAPDMRLELHKQRGQSIHMTHTHKSINLRTEFVQQFVNERMHCESTINDWASLLQERHKMLSSDSLCCLGEDRSQVHPSVIVWINLDFRL